MLAALAAGGIAKQKLHVMMIVDTSRTMQGERIGERVTTGSWACMFAADEATFEAEWEAMYNDCVGMGYNEYVELQSSEMIKQVEGFQVYIK